MYRYIYIYLNMTQKQTIKYNRTINKYFSIYYDIIYKNKTLL